ncbi:uncharacterized protein [Branchiostoma lanceolatum]|uniref:uncharacterized protein n=1 Tax=Branchiostoma lanceolatum TaxID=7740 RepID=UPI003451F5A6
MSRLWSSEEGEEDEEGYQEDDEDDGDDDSDINFTDDDIAAQIRKAEMSRRFEYDSAHRVAESEALQEKKKSVRWKDQQELGGAQESVKTDSTEEGLKAQRTSAIKPHDGKTVANIPYPKHVPYYEDDSDASTPARIVFHHTPLPVTEEVLDPVNESNVPSEGTVTSPADIYNLYHQPESPSLHTLPPGQVNSVPKVPPEEDKPTSGTKPKSILKKKLLREEVVEVVQNNVNREEAEPQKPPPLPAPKSAFSGEVLEKDVQPTVNSNTTSELPPKKVSRFKAARQKHR